MNAAVWIRRLALAGVALCLVVVVLGAYVRLTAAGLGCPDWPGCYGHFTPSGAEQNPASQQAFPQTPLHVGKAWREMAHRYAAATLGLIIVVIAAFSIAYRHARLISIPFALLLLATVVFQGILGMLTVTWQLKPLIVSLHLLFGLTTLSLLWWLWLSLSHTSWATVAVNRAASWPLGGASRSPRRLVILAFVALGMQIALGGWTSSNYAAVACPDLPKCQDRWVPEMDYADAFVLWRGLGTNYEGGVLDHPARVAIHFTHRLGAVVASTALIVAAIAVFRRRSLAPARWAATAVLVALLAQLIIGVAMVQAGFPLWIATLHNAGAAMLTIAALTLLQRVTRGKG